MSWFLLVLLFCLVGVSLQANVFLRFGHLSVAASPSLTFQVDDSAGVAVEFSNVVAFQSFAVKNGSKITASSPNHTFTKTLDAEPAEGSYWSFWIVPSTPASRRRRFVRLSNSSKPLFFQEKLPAPVFNFTATRVRAINMVPGSENTPVTVINNQTNTTVLTLFPQVYDTSGDYTFITPGSYVINGCNGTSVFRQLATGFVYTIYNYGGDLGNFQCSIAVDQGLDQSGAQVSIIHSSPDTPTVSVSFGLAKATLSFGQQSTYQTTLAQNSSYSVTLNGIVVTSGFFSLEANLQYSLLISGFSNKSRIGKPLAVQLIRDQLPPNTNSAIRLMNVVPDLTSVLTAAINLQNITLKDYATPYYVSLPPGNYLLQLYNSTSRGRRALSQENLILSTTVSVSSQGITSVLVEGTADNITVSQSNPTPTPTPDNGSSGLSGGAIAGIVIASIFGAILIAGLLVYFYRRANYQSIP